LKTYCCYQLCSHSTINNSSSSNSSSTESCDSCGAETAANTYDDAACDEQRVQYAWFLLSSANLSSYALGSEMAFLPDEYKCGSFEMGVMFLPSRLVAPAATDPTNVFSCDPGGPLDVRIHIQIWFVVQLYAKIYDRFREHCHCVSWYCVHNTRVSC
jgi:Tyrosyl-DNA phosphodiesterase